MNFTHPPLPPPRWLGIDLVRNRWIFPVCGALMTTLGGAAYAFSVFIKPLEAEFGWARADTVMAFSACMLFFGLFMWAGGYFVDKFGPRIPFIVGGVLMAVSQILSSQIQSVGGLVLTYGVMLGAGIGLAYTSSTIALSARWFPEKEKRGLAIGTSVFGFGIGALIAAPVWTAGIEAFGWRSTYVITGVVFLVLLFVLATIIRFPPDGYQFVEGKGWQAASENDLLTESQVTTNLTDFSFGEAFRNKFSWLTGLLFFLCIFGGLTTLSQLAPYAAESLPKGIGLTAAGAATVIMALSLFNGLGRPAWGAISGKIGPKRALIGSQLAMVLGLIVLAFAMDRTSVTAGAILVGFAFGGQLALNPVMATALFGASYIARIYGFIFFLGFGLGGFLGPRVGGMIHDATQGYEWVFITSAVLSLMSAVLSVFFFPAWGTEKQVRYSTSLPSAANR